MTISDEWCPGCILWYSAGRTLVSIFTWYLSPFLHLYSSRSFIIKGSFISLNLFSIWFPSQNASYRLGRVSLFYPSPTGYNPFLSSSWEECLFCLSQSFPSSKVHFRPTSSIKSSLTAPAQFPLPSLTSYYTMVCDNNSFHRSTGGQSIALEISTSPWGC